MEISLVGIRPDPTRPWLDANVYAIPQMVAGQAKIHLFGAPGHKLFVDTTVANSEVRGMIHCGNFVYVVAGSAFYYFGENQILSSLLGTLSTSTGRVQMVSNGLQIMIIDGLHGYVYTFGTGVFGQISDADFMGASSLTYQDGYGIVTVPSSGQFQISDLYDFTVWSALDYATAEGWPDNVLAGISDHRELWLFGETTTEVWQNTGAATFPFQRASGGFLQEGIAAAKSIAQIDESLIWLTNQLEFVKTSGYAPLPISSDQVQYLLSKMARVDDAIAFAWKFRKNAFYQITFPTENVTLECNITTGLWHRRMSGASGRYRGNCYLFAWGKHLIGDSLNGKVYQIDPETYTEDGEEIRRIHTLPPVRSRNGVDAMAHNRLTLLMKCGFGLDADVVGSDPQISLSYSDDGEMTWSKERTASVGKIGEYSKRVAWRRLGGAINRSYRVMITDPVEMVVSEAVLD